MKENKMKDSGIKWIGKIPEDWNLKRAKYLFKERFGGAWGEDSKGDENDRICIRIADFDYPRLKVKRNIDFTKRNYDKATISKVTLKNKDLLIEKSGGGEKTPVGRVVLYDLNEKALFANFMDVLRVKEDYSAEYINYLFYCMYATGCTFFYVNQTTGIQNLNLSALLDNEMFPVFSKQEQKRIAEFLDKKCADIDNIILKTEKQIETLEQYKKSLITETVTKGLNPNVNMVFSNVKQIGNIPRHWAVKRIRYVLSENNGIKVGPFGSSLTGLVLDEGPVKIYGQWNVVDKSFNAGKNYVSLDTYNNLKKYEVKPHDILISMMGTIGGCIIVPEGIDKGIMDSHIIKIRLKKFMNPKYFYYFYDKDNSNAVFAQLEFLKTGSIMDGLNSNILKNINVCIPPLREQDEIVNYLDKKCEDIDEVLNKQKESLETLKKYKQSLIYEYVTGKKRV